MQAVAPPAPRHQATRELVDDHHLAVLDHVLDVELIVDVCAQPLLDVMQQGHVGRVVEAARLKAVGEQLLGVRHARLGEGHRLVLLVDGVVAGGLEPIAVLGLDLALVDLAFLQLRNDPIHLVVEVGRLLGRARDDQWRARFIDEDAVHFVHDGEVVAALDHAPQVELHVVAQVVEPELVVASRR